VGYRKNPLIRAVPYRYIPTSLTGGFFTEVASPTSPSHYADRDDFFVSHFRRRYRRAPVCGRPSDTKSAAACPACQRPHFMGELCKDQCDHPFPKPWRKASPSEWRKHVFQKRGWVTFWKLFPNRLIGERTTNPPEHEDDRPRGAAQMPLISTEPHCTVVLFAPDRGGLCAVPILKIRERDTGKRVWAPTGRPLRRTKF
jgi:hypothetical protein